MKFAATPLIWRLREDGVESLKVVGRRKHRAAHHPFQIGALGYKRVELSRRRRRNWPGARPGQARTRRTHSVRLRRKQPCLLLPRRHLRRRPLKPALASPKACREPRKFLTISRSKLSARPEPARKAALPNIGLFSGATHRERARSSISMRGQMAHQTAASAGSHRRSCALQVAFGFT